MSILSHELRTPLTPILGWTRLLRTARLDEQHREQALAVIERNVYEEIRIVEDLLEVSRMMVGSMRLEPRRLDVRSAVGAAVQKMLAEADRKGVALLLSLPAQPAEIFGDDDRLHRAIANLVNNAIKFTPAGGRVEVTLTHSEGQAVVLVRDNGEGIRPESLPRIFDRFQRGDLAVNRTDGGLGLGLFIAREIAQLHGGSITAHSDGPGQGALFVMRLPAEPAARPVAVSGIEAECQPPAL